MNLVVTATQDGAQNDSPAVIGKNVGEYTATITAKISGSAAGYKITDDEDTADIKLSIEPKPVTVIADDKQKTYGSADPKLTATENGLLNGDTLKDKYKLVREEGEDAGKYGISFDFDDDIDVSVLNKLAVVFGADKKATIGNYEVTFKDGTLTINPAPLTITTPSATKVYDGTALTRTKGSVSGLKNGETATVTGTGKQTAVGSSKNGYTLAWGTAKSKNYKVVQEKLGTLTVTAADDDDPTPTPTPDGGGNNPGGGGGNPAGGGGNPAAAPAAGTTVPDAPVPQAEPEP
jgi:hypothetical protein